MALTNGSASHGDPRYCGALGRSGNPCRREAGWGTDHFGVGRCKFHLGSTRNHRTNALQILTERRVQHELGALLAELELDGENVDPLDVLSEQMARAQAMVTVLGMLVGQLPMQMEQYGDEGQMIESGMYGPDHQGDGRPHVLVTMYGDWMDRAGKLSKLAKDAGLEERRQALSDDDVDRHQSLMRATAELQATLLASLGVGAEQLQAWRDATPGLVRQAAQASGVIETTGAER